MARLGQPAHGFELRHRLEDAHPRRVAQRQRPFHEELIDYDVPGAWDTIDDGRSLNSISECLAPFDDGRAAPSRQDVLEHWRATHKFGRVDPLFW